MTICLEGQESCHFESGPCTRLAEKSLWKYGTPRAISKVIYNGRRIKKLEGAEFTQAFVFEESCQDYFKGICKRQKGTLEKTRKIRSTLSTSFNCADSRSSKQTTAYPSRKSGFSAA